MPSPAIAMNGLLDAEYFDFESTHVGDSFRIFVAKPPFADKDKRYPAIYATDGNGSFPMVTSIQRTLAWGGEAPAAFVIGVENTAGPESQKSVPNLQTKCARVIIGASRFTATTCQTKHTCQCRRR